MFKLGAIANPKSDPAGVSGVIVKKKKKINRPAQLWYFTLSKLGEVFAELKNNRKNFPKFERLRKEGIA